MSKPAGSTYNHSALEGIIPPLVTPLLERDKLDIHGLENLIEYVIDGGVSAIFILGSTGEAPSLSYKLRAEMIRHAAKIVDGRIPVLVGITDTSFVESVNIADIADKYGAQGAVLAPPYYFPTSQEEFLIYLSHLLPELSLPLYLYNIPSNTKFSFEVETVKEAAKMPGVAGFKDSSGDLTFFSMLIETFKERKDFSLLIGPEELLAKSVLLGGHGGINGGANFHPKLYVDLYHAAKAEDMQTVRKLQSQVIQNSMSLYNVGNHNGSKHIKATKTVLSLLGICNDFMAEPFHKFGAQETEELRSHLKDLDLL